MIETKEKEIDGATYAVTQFPGRKALTLKVRLLSVVGPSLLSTIGAVKGGTGEVEIDSLGGAAQKLVDNLSKEGAVNLVMELLSSTRRDGHEITPQLFDMEFAGKLDTVWKVVWWVLEVNYGSFFAGKGIGIGSILDRFGEKGSSSTD